LLYPNVKMLRPYKSKPQFFSEISIVANPNFETISNNLTI